MYSGGGTSQLEPVGSACWGLIGKHKDWKFVTWQRAKMNHIHNTLVTWVEKNGEVKNIRSKQNLNTRLFLLPLLVVGHLFVAWHYQIEELVHSNDNHHQPINIIKLRLIIMKEIKKKWNLYIVIHVKILVLLLKTYLILEYFIVRCK